MNVKNQETTKPEFWTTLGFMFICKTKPNYMFMDPQNRVASFGQLLAQNLYSRPKQIHAINYENTNQKITQLLTQFMLKTKVNSCRKPVGQQPHFGQH